ncbi:MAG: pyridoxamine 5'-phosphate oxidase family protein [Spirochaetaceae bacterium]|jgi:nitroimidazol reductase NimA-like FMN-containing flavoprotein (pyridoxamine 5'-phosphate oxidase superfamily)|nr:pyridoxamine 5'-phosphate oxidase family protein [Spirochaetaceae bacterium]
MRRKDREISRQEAEQVIDSSDFAVMATVNQDGTPYCVPLSLARDGQWLYFHCATEGKKLDNLRYQNKVFISFVSTVSIPHGFFTCHYRSALIAGSAEEITVPSEKIAALKCICERFTQDNMAHFDEALARSLSITGVWKVHIDSITGKAKGSG